MRLTEMPSAFLTLFALLYYSVSGVQGSRGGVNEETSTERNVHTGTVGNGDYPLTLHLAVLDVTDSLNRETSQNSWQAMLRALGGHREVLRRFAQIRQEFSTLEKRVGVGKSYGIEERLDQLAKLNASTTWAAVWPTVQSAIKRVADLYAWFDRYQRNAAVVNDRTLTEYAEIVHGQEGLTAQNAIESLHYLICTESSPTKDCAHESCKCSGSAIDALSHAIARSGDGFFCSGRQSPHQMLYDFHLLLALSDAKAFAMTQFSWILLRLHGKGEYVNEANEARTSYLRRTAEKTDGMRTQLSRVSTWMWNCEDLQNNTTETIEFTGLLQGFITNEINLNEEKSCKESCSAYIRNEEKHCAPNQPCSSLRKCNGRIHDCKFIEADSQVCSSATPNRRYDWIRYKSGRLFGSDTECKNEHQHQVNSWWRWLFWHCSYCMCLCDEPGQHSDRYISLQSAVASANENRLVTGVRFVKMDRTVHIQIQQAQALPQGYINESTVEWVYITPVHLRPSNTLEDGPGYATLRYDERSLDLDDLLAPQDHVITGIRFRKIGGHLNLEMQTAPIEFATGLIDADKVIWTGNDNTPASETRPRRKLEQSSPDVLPGCNALSFPDSKHNEYIDFEPTSLEKDVAQTTIPFLDASVVTPSTLTWLKGVGIFHRGHSDCGGYIGLRISTYNFAPQMKTPEEYYAQVSDNDSIENSY